MRNSENSRTFVAMGALLVAAAMAAVACSKGDTVNNGTTDAGPQVTTCGSLSPQQAAQIATGQLEHLGTVGLAALAGLENSRAAARLISFGDTTIVDPFVSDNQSNLHDSLVKLRDEQLVAANIEMSTASSVTFLLGPQTLCGTTTSTPVVPAGIGGAAGTGGQAATGGTTAASLDPACVSEKTAHPMRIRISRIACDQGDNVAIELLIGTASERVLVAELYADHANVQLDIGAFLRESYSSIYTYVQQPNGTYVTQRTEKPAVTSATGVLLGSLTLTASTQAKAAVSVTQPIDITFADDSAARLRIAACTGGLTVDGNGDAKTIKVTVNAGAFDWRAKFNYFISDFFGLQTTASASTADPVDIHVPGLQGNLDLDGTQDTITATGLNLGGADVMAKQGSNTLLSFGALSASQGAIAATLTGNVNNNLGVTLPQGLSVDIHYGLQPVLSLVQNPENFLAGDTMTVSASASSSLTLFNEAATNQLTVTSSPTGPLLRVDAGTLGISSAKWPSDSVTVPTPQCLSRTVTALTGHNDLLDDFSIGACP